MNNYIFFLNKNKNVFQEIDRIELNTNYNNSDYIDFYFSNSDIRYEFTIESIRKLILSVKLDESLKEYNIKIPGFDDNINVKGSVKGNNYLPFLYFECKEGSLIFRKSDTNANENSLTSNFSLYLKPDVPEDLLIKIIHCFNKIFEETHSGVQIFEKDYEYFKNLKKYF
jgi:hypothetical protein